MLVNGFPSRQFKASGGICQGDPLSPFLFTIVAEALGALLVRATDIGLVKGFEAVKNGKMISHLQFADDAILFCSANEEEVFMLKRILRCFQLVSGLKVNLCKSSLVGVGCSGALVRLLARKIHCNNGKLPAMYLGPPNWGKGKINGGVEPSN